MRNKGWIDALTFPSANADITFPKADSDLLIFLASSNTIPSAPVLLTYTSKKKSKLELKLYKRNVNNEKQQTRTLIIAITHLFTTG